MSQEKIEFKEIIKSAQKQLLQDFEKIKKHIPHSGEGGTEIENVLKKFLKGHLPRRFDVESGFGVGQDETVSNQTDIIIFDALNCPIYLAGSNTYLIPKDNIAIAIEVKSKINKAQLKDAAEKIASIKKLPYSPITNVDQPVTFSELIITNTLGCVFAFDSYTTLTALANNLKEINSNYDSDYWIDLVVVLNKGYICYGVQKLFENQISNFFGGKSEKYSISPPYYIHLMKHESGDLTLNHFFARVIAHLTFFRRRSTIDMSTLLGSDINEISTIMGYQYNTSNKLIPVEDSHKVGKFKNPSIRFNIYSKKDDKFVGQVCYLPWQDGAVITCSSLFDPQIVLQHYFEFLKITGKIFYLGQNLCYSQVLGISEADFIKISKSINGNMKISQDSNDNNSSPHRFNYR